MKDSTREYSFFITNSLKLFYMIEQAAESIGFIGPLKMKRKSNYKVLLQKKKKKKYIQTHSKPARARKYIYQDRHP